MNWSSGVELMAFRASGMGEERPMDLGFVSFSLSADLRPSCATSSVTSTTSTVALLVPSSTDFFSAFRLSIHHSDPVASHASVRTE